MAIGVRAVGAGAVAQGTGRPIALTAVLLVVVESAKAVLALGGYETPILAMRFPTDILYYRKEIS